MHSTKKTATPGFGKFHNTKDIPLVKTEKTTDERLRAIAPEVLPRRIEFVKSKSVVSTNKIDEKQYDELKSKLIQLNGVYDPQKQQQQQQQQAGEKNKDNFLREHYAMSTANKVKVIGDNGEWLWWWGKSNVRGVGAGLVNTGVTCFMNSTLQALTYTPPLASFLLSEESTKYHKPCKEGHFCGFCMIRDHVKTALTSGKKYFLPRTVLANLKNINKMFRRGREEDAHECLRFILERMQDACLGKKSNSTTKKKIGIEQEMETFIYRTFGFKTVSCVHCTSCGHNSLTFDPALDISLDVKGVGSISDSFRKFYKADILSGDNKYRCSGCNKRVVAKKFSRLCTAPRVLTIHLKRFSFSAFGPTKYQKHVDFSPRFSLEVNGLNYVYDLYGVLVHTGIAQAGHYYSFMKSPSGAWYLFDDELVRSVNISTVLKQNAYILFYALAPTSIPTPTPLSTIPAVSLPEGEIDIYSAQSPAPQAKEKNNSKEVVDLCSDEEKMLVEEKNTKVTHTKQGPEESKKVVITAENSLKKKIVVSKYKKLIFKEEVLNALKKGSITTTSISTTTEGEEHQGKLQLPKKKKAKTTSYNEEKLNDDNNNNNQDESPAKTMVVEQPRKSAWKLKSEERELKKIATVKELHSGNRSQFGEKVGKWDAEEGNGGDAVDTREKELSRLEPKIRGPSKWDEDYDAPKAPKKKKKGEDVLGKDHSKTFDELQRTREANRKDPGRFSKMAPGKRQAKLNKREKQDMKQKQKQKQQLFHNNKFSNKNVHGHQKHNNNKNSHYNNNKRK